MRDNRISRRHVLTIPVIHTDPVMRNFYEATMHNTCMNGMALETVRPLPKDACLYIRATPAIRKCHPHDVYIGRVRWCREKNGSAVSRFGVGIQHTFKGRLLDSKEIRDFRYSCDLCGDGLKSEIHFAGEGSHFCRDCFMGVGQMAGGGLQDVILKYSIGNVI